MEFLKGIDPDIKRILLAVVGGGMLGLMVHFTAKRRKAHRARTAKVLYHSKMTPSKRQRIALARNHCRYTGAKMKY